MADREITLQDDAQVAEGIELVKRGPLQGDWTQQYRRMLRSHARLRNVAEGRIATEDSDEAIDALFHFFQDSYHLKDWIKNSLPQYKSAVEGLFKKTTGVEEMQMCADLCNGTKHFTLTAPRAGAAFNSHSIAVRPAPASSGRPPDPALHSWTVRRNADADIDALDLAQRCVTSWHTWLTQKDLRPDTQ